MPVLYGGLRRLTAFFPYILKGRRYMELMKKYNNQSTVDLADRHFSRGTVLNRLFGALGYPNMSVQGIAGLFLTAAEDYWYIQEGFQHLADTLAGKFRKNSGDLRLGARVTRIATSGGRAVGVVCSGATESADFIISACDYKKTFAELLDDPSLLPAGRLEKIRKAAVSEGMCTVYLGLTMTGTELRAHMRTPGVLCGDYANDVNFASPSDPAHFSKVGLSLFSPSLINPALAPEGKSSLMIMALAPARWQDNWRHADRKAYKALKESVKKTLIERAEAVVPGLRPRIEFEDAATPLTYERYTGNTDGATSAWSWNPAKRFYDSGMMGISVDTPVRNLLIGSCWATQMGGIPGALAAAYEASRRVG